MNYLPKNLRFDEGVAFINDFSLIDISSEHGTPLIYMIGIISKTIYLNSQMLLVKILYIDMLQKPLSAKNLSNYWIKINGVSM